jgi:hypothetical protein
VVIAFEPIKENNPLLLYLKKATREETSFTNILYELVKQKSDKTMNAYNELFGENKTIDA